MLETAGRRYVGLVREPTDRGRSVFLQFAGVLRPVSGAGQPDVFRVGSKPVDVRPQLLGSLRAVEAEPDQLRVVGGQAHGVESLAGHLVRSQVVDGVPPQGEARAPFHQQDLDARLVPGPGLAAVVEHHRDPGELQVPATFRRRVVHVQVGHRSAHVHLYTKMVGVCSINRVYLIYMYTGFFNHHMDENIKFKKKTANFFMTIFKRPVVPTFP